MNPQEIAKLREETGLDLPDITFPWTVDTIGKCIVDSYSIQILCHTYGCHHFGEMDLIAFAKKHGVNHGSLEKDLKRYFYCQKCKVSGRPHKNISFRLTPQKDRRQIIEGAWTGQSARRNSYAKAKGV